MAIEWKVAASLEQLRVQLNELAPRRSKVSDGSIADAAHATRDSDHNPWFVLTGQPLVTARDFTHDPAGGLHCQRLADALLVGRDRRIKYVIWDRQIMSGADGVSPWSWRGYSGANPHIKHLHLSVVPDARAQLRIPWLLPGLGSTPAPVSPPRPSTEDTDMDDRQAAQLDTLVAQITGSPDPWTFPGWQTWDGGTGEQLTVVNLLRRANVETQQVHPRLARLEAKIDAVVAAQQVVSTGGVDLDALAERVVDLLAARLRD